LRLGVGWSFVLELEMVEQVFIREEAMVRGQRLVRERLISGTGR